MDATLIRKPIEAPASAEITSERQQKLQRAASSRMTGLRIVLEDCEDVGNRAAILRTAEAFGLLHIHEIPGAELKTPNGRAKKIGVAHSGQKWLRISVHSSAAECVAALRAAGCESILAAVPAAAAIPPSESWHAARVRNPMEQAPWVDREYALAAGLGSKASDRMSTAIGSGAAGSSAEYEEGTELGASLGADPRTCAICGSS